MGVRGSDIRILKAFLERPPKVPIENTQIDLSYLRRSADFGKDLNDKLGKRAECNSS